MLIVDTFVCERDTCLPVVVVNCGYLSMARRLRTFPVRRHHRSYFRGFRVCVGVPCWRELVERLECGGNLNSRVEMCGGRGTLLLLVCCFGWTHAMTRCGKPSSPWHRRVSDPPSTSPQSHPVTPDSRPGNGQQHRHEEHT